MKPVSTLLSPLLHRSALALLLACPLAGGLASAQTAAPANSTSSRPDQTIERIRTEDAGARIDELRVGGETQTITVQPKHGSKLPAYEVKPSDSSRGSAPSASSGDTAGSRVWNVLNF